MANAKNERKKKLSKIIVAIVVIVLALTLQAIVTNQQETVAPNQSSEQ